MTPLSVVCLLIALIPFGDPADGFSKNLSFGIVFTLFLPLVYSSNLDWFITHNMKIKFTWRRNIGFAGITCVLTFLLNLIMGLNGKYPLEYSFVYFFVVVCTVLLIWALFSFWESKKRKKEKRNFKSRWVFIFTVFLLLGWGFAALTMKYFNNANMFVQTFIMSALAVWKCTVAQSIKLYSLMTKQHGEKYELMLVSFVCISIHWFWTLFTNLAFAAVESWLTFTVYLLLDIIAASVFIYQCSDHYQTRQLKRSEGSWFPRFVKIESVGEEDEKETLDKSYDVLFNCCCFILIQFGELTFAAYTLLLFLCCRYGPNADHSPLGRLEQHDFMNLIYFLIVMLLTELFCAVLCLRVSVRRFFTFDPRPYIGDFVREKWYLFVFTPVMLHFPCLTFMFDHSGMGFTVGVD
ncbi:hypothetical protein TL16_g03662 [Triparma laevis f. inornata]|uniref:Uncharacterized protein n=2 Tax=Triparma laevis TaxID=1534972 RepID=A0A9W7DUC2_9STRA|nr:hypothetical protein TrLO_g5123 [Triparma laevis f. longispina]GMH63249.1 hypothetical protein TL16_g03662 [Triparma laevis f. inornata]